MNTITSTKTVKVITATISVESDVEDLVVMGNIEREVAKIFEAEFPGGHGVESLSWKETSTAWLFRDFGKTIETSIELTVTMES